MTYEFEGKTEKDAIEKAMQELGLERDSFDVEILEAQRGGLFKKGYVKIRLHTGDEPERKKTGGYEERSPRGREDAASDEPPDEAFEAKMIEFIGTILNRMNCQGRIRVERREKKKTGFTIDSTDSGIIIGKKGKTLDSLQLLATVYAAKINNAELKIVVDCEKYRLHHEESLVRLAYSVASKVRNTRHSILLEPMNPYDRRLVHSIIGETGDIETNSEGEGLYKQIRVSYRGR
jgi:spoIIIJ-associated protein